MGGARSFTPNDLPDLTGRVILVTGGSSGLGKESIVAFTQKGAKVYMAARSESRAMAAIGDIKAKVPDAKVEFIEMDMMSFESIKKGTDEFLRKESTLHVLLNNAGVMGLPYSKTKDGYEIQFGINHMGHFLLTKLLQPTLIKTVKSSPEGIVRIVNVSSLAHNKANGIPFDDMHNENSQTWTRYAVSKLANILHAKALSRRLKEHGIIVTSVHPGIISSPLWKGASFGIVQSIFWRVAGYFFTSSEVGAYTQIYCSASPDLTLVDSGDYYVPVAKKGAGMIHGPSVVAQDEALAEELYDWSEAELRKHEY